MTMDQAAQDDIAAHAPKTDLASASLLDRQASGGDTAGGGFTFQENVLLARIPMWLSRDGFASMISEAIGDTEAKFFIPGRGDVIELVEAKNHRVTPAEFWREIDRFQQLDRASPGAYAWFTLVSGGLSYELHPLVNGLRRIRGAYGFYGDGTAVHASSFAGFTEIVLSFGRCEADARFIFEKVLLDAQQAEALDHGEGLFAESLGRWLPEYQNLPYKVLKEVRSALGNLVRQRGCQTITRGNLEGRLTEAIPPDMRPSPRAVSLYTSITQDEPYSGSSLILDWLRFFGGQQRDYPPPPEWANCVLAELQATRDWILRSRTTRTVRLQGNRRLSAAICIGSVFSAVAGFTIEMEYRGEIWRTDAYPDASTPPYMLQRKEVDGAKNHLVVTIGISRAIAAEVEGDLGRHGLDRTPILHLYGDEPILSPAQANVAVQTIKREIACALRSMQAQRIELFYAGPAHLALFLGHRLNATANVQCYEWVSPGLYVPTSSFG